MRAVFHGAIADSSAVERIGGLVAAVPENPETFGIALNLATLGNVGLNEVVGSVNGVDTSLRLRDIADSYIWITGVDGWEPCQLISDVITSDNLDEIEARYQALDPRVAPWTQTELEQIREEGQAKLVDSWVKLPVKEEAFSEEVEIWEAPVMNEFILGVDLDGVWQHTEIFREIVARELGVAEESLPLERSWDLGSGVWTR